MKLFDITNESLTHVPTQPFKLEKEIQSLIENSLEEIFELELVRSELTIQNFRFDTLCFDRENNSFVIIEYKKGANYSVIDQGYTYLSVLLNNKSDFILEYNETKDETLRRDDIDWTQSRIIFISPKFSEYQKNSINFKDMPFELWEITRFKNKTVGLNRIQTTSDVSINSTTTNDRNVVKQVSKEVKKYDEDYHLHKTKKRHAIVLELYQRLKERILQLGDDIEIKPLKQTIGFKRYKSFTDIIVSNKGLWVVLNVKKGDLNDPLGKTEDISEKGHWGNGDYRIWLENDDDFEYTIGLIKQAYAYQNKA